MSKIHVADIKGNERLAKDIFFDNNTIILAAGTILKKEYIERLIRLNINEVTIFDDVIKNVQSTEITEDDIKIQCYDMVKKTIDRFRYYGQKQHDSVIKAVEAVVEKVLENEKVLYCVSGLRRKSEDIYSHSVSVCTLSVLIAMQLKLPKDKIYDIAVGSLLHDIGYCLVNVNLDNEKSYKYTNEEKKELKKHVIYGYNAVENENWLSTYTKNIILLHHEACNGTGYPFHLNEEHIKLGCKIVAVADLFDRLVYGSFITKMKIHEAVEYILTLSGVTLSHEVVKIFNATIASYPNGTIVYTSEGDIAVVIRQNYKCPTRPVIRIIEDKSGYKYTNWIEKDLTQYLTLFITDTLETIQV